MAINITNEEKRADIIGNQAESIRSAIRDLESFKVEIQNYWVATEVAYILAAVDQIKSRLKDSTVKIDKYKAQILATAKEVKAADDAEAKRKAEEEAKKKAAEEAKRKAEEAKRKAEEEAKKTAELEKLNKEYQKAHKAYVKADQEYTKAREAYEKYQKEYDSAPVIRKLTMLLQLNTLKTEADKKLKQYHVTAETLADLAKQIIAKGGSNPLGGSGSFGAGKMGGR